MHEEILVDARGHRCPTPTLKLAKALREAPSDVVIRLLADDPMARIDVPHFAAQAGIEVLDIRSTDKGLAILLRSPGPKQDTARRGSGAPPGDLVSS